MVLLRKFLILKVPWDFSYKRCLELERITAGNERILLIYKNKKNWLVFSVMADKFSSSLSAQSGDPVQIQSFGLSGFIGVGGSVPLMQGSLHLQCLNVLLACVFHPLCMQVNERSENINSVT